jgi:hypothetical protein
MNIGLNPYMQYANQEIDWLSMDTEELYQENLKNNYDKLLKHNWINNPFTYKFNSAGFRSEEFEESAPSIMFLGCSMTVGIGVPWNTTWPKIVSDELGMKCYNLGIGGSSNDTAFRFAYTWLNKLKPTICIFNQTFADRMEVWQYNGIIGDMSKEHPKFYLGTWQSNNFNKKILAEKNLLAIKQLCDQSNTKFVNTSVHSMPYLDLARDLAHPGIQSNQEYAKMVLAKI